MGSPVDNPGRYISLSSEDLLDDPLQSRIPRLVGYPLIDCISQVSSIIVLLGRIVKFRGGIGELSQTGVLFLSLPCPKGSNIKDLGEASGVRTLDLWGVWIFSRQEDILRRVEYWRE